MGNILPFPFLKSRIFITVDFRLFHLSKVYLIWKQSISSVNIEAEYIEYTSSICRLPTILGSVMADLNCISSYSFDPQRLLTYSMCVRESLGAWLVDGLAAFFFLTRGKSGKLKAILNDRQCIKMNFLSWYMGKHSASWVIFSILVLKFSKCLTYRLCQWYTWPRLFACALLGEHNGVLHGEPRS